MSDFMTRGATPDLTLEDEFRIRRWAREYYVPAEQRHRSWHPVFLAEMARLDEELIDSESRRSRAHSFVPLAPGEFYRLDPRHAAMAAPKILLTIARVSAPEYHGSR